MLCIYRSSFSRQLHQAFAVFILYIRCTSINPADPGIMSKFDDGHVNAPESNTGLQGTNLPAKTGIATGTNSPTSTCRSSLDGRTNHGGLAAGDTDINIRMQPLRRRSGCYFGGFICALFVKEDCRKSDDSENQVDAEDALFCTLCNAEVHSPTYMWMFKFELFDCSCLGVRVCLICVQNQPCQFLSWPNFFLSLFGWLPSFWHAHANLPSLVHFSCQHWPNHGQAKPWPKFWLAKNLVGCTLAQNQTYP